MKSGYKQFSIKDLETFSSIRPEGYYEEVLSLCERDGDTLKMPTEEWVKLRNKYYTIEREESEQEQIEETTDLTLKEKLRSASKSFSQWAGSGFKIAPKESYDERLGICKSCDFWDPTAFADTGKCKLCGCSTVAKLRMATEKCPIGKW
jgi:hypothetical protein